MTNNIAEYSVIHHDLKFCNENLIKDIDSLRNQFDIKLTNSLDTNKSFDTLINKIKMTDNKENTDLDGKTENFIINELDNKLKNFEDMNSKYFVTLANLVTQNDRTDYVKEINNLIEINQNLKLENCTLKSDLDGIIEELKNQDGIIEELKNQQIDPQQQDTRLYEMQQANNDINLQNKEQKQEIENMIYLLEEASQKNNYLEKVISENESSQQNKYMEKVISEKEASRKNNYLDKIISELSQELDTYRTLYERENINNNEVIKDLNDKFESQKNASDKLLNYNIKFFDTNNKLESENIKLEDEANFYKQQNTEISNELHIFQLENQHIRKNNDDLNEL